MRPRIHMVTLGVSDLERSLGFYRAPPGELGPDKEISHKRSKVRWFARPVGAHWQLKTSNAEL